MENYIVSARKYRPSTFESVVGQEVLTQTLKNAIENNHLAHAYLFCGPRGVGKTTCARIFAKTINCLHPTSGHEACNECDSCRDFNEQRSMNIHELDAASNNGVEEIRALIEQTRIPPQIGKYSVFIIDEVHMLSQGAFNALLKTLEEPPSYVIFILATTEKHKVLPTILSRCQVYDFARITIMDTIHHLQFVAKNEGVQVTEEALNVVAQKADGGMRDALSIFDQLVAFCGKSISYEQTIEALNVLDSDYYFKLVDFALAGDVAGTLLLLNDVLNKGFDAQNFVVGFAAHLRDVLVSKDSQTAILLETSGTIRQHYAEQAKRVPAMFIIKALSLVNECDINYRTAKNKRLTVEIMLIKLCQLIGVEQETKPSPMQTIQTSSSQSVQPKVSQVAVSPAKENVAAATISQVNTSPTNTAGEPLKPARPVKTAYVSTISISDDDDSQQDKPDVMVHEEVTVETKKSTTTLDENTLFNAWRQLSKLFPTDQRFLAILINAKLSITGPSSFDVQLTNEVQKTEVLESSDIILNFLKEELNNQGLKMSLSIPEVEYTEVFSTADKYNMFSNRNPEFEHFVKELGLQIE